MNFYIDMFEKSPHESVRWMFLSSDMTVSYLSLGVLFLYIFLHIDIFSLYIFFVPYWSGVLSTEALCTFSTESLLVSFVSELFVVQHRQRGLLRAQPGDGSARPGSGSWPENPCLLQQ